MQVFFVAKQVPSSGKQAERGPDARWWGMGTWVVEMPISRT